MEFKFHTVDFGDSDHESFGESVWVAAFIDGDESRAIGAYVTVSGEIETDDYTAWNIDNDLEILGVEPGSDEAEAILAAWFPVAREKGLAELAALKR